MTMHQRFQVNPLGFDSFGAWMRHYEKLQAQFPLGCTKVSEEWLDLWKGLGELLKMPAVVERRYGRQWLPDVGVGVSRNAAYCLEFGHRATRAYATRVLIWDGTIIKEWSAK